MATYNLSIVRKLGGLMKYRRFSGIQPKTVFSLTLIAVTLLPLTLILLNSHSAPVQATIAFMLALSSTHVFSTFYLLTDPDVRKYFRDHPFRMIGVPFLLTATLAIIYVTSGPLFFISVLAGGVWQSWHFGAQNIGV